MSTPPSDGSQPSSTPPKPGSDFLSSDTTSNRFKNFCRMVIGTMSPEGQKLYWDDADKRYEAVDRRRCEAWRDELLRTSPVIRYMNDNIRKLGGEMGPHNIRCRSCIEDGQRMLGGFDQEYGIKICANYMESKNMMEDTLAHEMVHAYDHLRFKTKLNEDLRHAACTEV